MQTIGDRLEEARKRKGVSIREAAESTKIRGDYLQKFEANTFEIDLPPLYMRGFLRTYAKFLELDAERIVADVDAMTGRESKPQKRDHHREALGRVDFGGNEPRASSDTGEPTTKNNGGGGGGSGLDQATMIKYGALGGGAVILIVVIILLVNVLSSRSPSKTTAQQQQAAAQQAGPIVQADLAQTLVLTAVEATRVKVVQDLDKAVLFNGAMARGEAKSFKKQGKLLITVEAGKNLRMEVNGRNYAVPLDGYGQFGLD